MKNKYFIIAFSAFSFLAGLTDSKAQETPFLQFGGAPAKKDTIVVKKTSMWSKITKTPWIINVGPDVVDDNGSKFKSFKLIHDVSNYYPIHTSAEKYFKKGLSIQGVFSSETMNTHHFTSVDLNVKYNLKQLIGDTKWFDPYALLGVGYTYRLYPHGLDTHIAMDNSYNANIGGGVNIWFFKNAGIYAQTLAKFNMHQSDALGGGNYIQFSAGVVFKIGGEAIASVPVGPEIKATPPNTYKRSKEAEDAAQYLRDILNK